MENNIPLACKGVKCMIKGCLASSSHKVGEINVFDPIRQSEQCQKLNHSHESTTYLCDEHFDALMDREEKYFKTDERFTDENN